MEKENGKKRKKKVLVLGGGVTGLTVAATLSRKGHTVTLLEAENTVGGLARTMKFNGQQYDLGPHEFCTNHPSLVNYLKELLEDDFLVRHKQSAQFFMDRLIDYPIKPLHILRQMDNFLILRIFFEIIYFRFKNLLVEPMDYSFKQWVENRFGVTMYEIYFKPYTEKVWGIDPGQLDLRTASDRIGFNSVFDILYKTLLYYFTGKEQFNSIHNPLKSKFYYSNGGIGTLMEALSRQCKDAGCTVRLNWTVKEVLVEEQKIKTVVSENGETETGYDYVVSTIPLTKLNETMGRGDLNFNLRYRGMIFCFLEVPRKNPSPYHWLYFPEKKYSFQRTSEFSLFEANMTKPGHSAICAEVACFPTDPLWQSDDEDIVGFVEKDLIDASVLNEPKGVKEWVYRENYAYPIQVNGFLEHVSNSLSYIKSITNLTTTGRQGLYKYCNMNECMEL
ncbi:MAG: FAD-dependent oxidoreductase, partial [Nitrospinota bacterium]